MFHRSTGSSVWQFLLCGNSFDFYNGRYSLASLFYLHGIASSQGYVRKPCSYRLTFGVYQVLAKALLKRIDQRKTCHCEEKFESEKELAEHQTSCVFRPVSCSNDGCAAVFSATHGEAHDASCEYKLFPCYLDCESSVQRKDMAEHCATVCPMKKAKCPYHSVGCLHVMAQVQTLH